MGPGGPDKVGVGVLLALGLLGEGGVPGGELWPPTGSG